jgi:hypothetical protein
MSSVGSILLYIVSLQGVTKEGNAKAEAQAEAFRRYVLLEEKV